MTTPDRPLTREALAKEKLGKTVGWTYRHLRRLERERGFPRPYLPNTWSEAAVDAWIRSESWGAAADPQGDAPPAAHDQDDDTGWAAQLDANARRVAAGLGAR